MRKQTYCTTMLCHPMTLSLLPLYHTEKLKFPLDSYLPATWTSNNTTNFLHAVNKQLNDKERVAAALENPNLIQLVDECLYSNDLWSVNKHICLPNNYCKGIAADECNKKNNHYVFGYQSNGIYLYRSFSSGFHRMCLPSSSQPHTLFSGWYVCMYVCKLDIILS